MTFRWLGQVLLGGVLTAVLAWSLPADDTDPKTPKEKPSAEESATDEAEPDAEEKPAAEEPDPFVVPDGTPEELIEYLEKLKSIKIRDFETFKKVRASALKAAEKILAGDPDDQQREIAIMTKMHVLSKPEDLIQFAEELKEAGDEKFVPRVMRLYWGAKVRTAMRDTTEEKKKIVEEAVKHMTKSPLEPLDIRLALQIGRLGESTREDAFALETYRRLGKLFGESENEILQKFSKRMKGIVRRLSLLGKKIELEGALMDGEPLDMAKYEGKVVLVDFWSTWCGPCVVGIPHLKKKYELYHDKGFEIIGISLDRKREDLEEFVEEKEIPWSIVYSDDGPSPSADYYGIMAIPTMILVDKDGKVVSLKARGKELDRLLEELFGPAEEKEASEEAEDSEKAKPPAEE